MKAVLTAGVIAALLSLAPARAEDAPTCTVPSYLIATESSLAKVAAAVKAGKPLNILVVGSGSSALAGPDGANAAYPARLEAALREKLSKSTINVRTDIRAKKTSAEVADSFESLVEKLPEDQKPALVIWQTGTIDAMRSIDPDDFRTALGHGVDALQKAGADALLMNLQYSPRMETMLSVSPYNDTMRVVAQEHDIPLFDRFSIMRHWNDAGDFDLFGPVHGFGMARQVHDCIGRSLATMIIEASRINPAELGMQR
ncbi:SGNH/GDSL hydrolase family protein [Bradyrhizobium sp. SYSU BS000235]|uniref:SGNH/GDSL hydrolase family protein n=1 Tax=Bradyrhizobium sp. SYSU BS000235 TaxID=3411332 RepID=UPI003C718C03